MISKLLEEFLRFPLTNTNDHKGMELNSLINLHEYDFSESILKYKRFKTREVYIGDIPLGANNPIRIQSMTTTDTLDTLKTVEQSIRMIEAGSEYVRITAPSLKEAENLGEIKRELRKRGFKTPLIADIHFTPNAAELAARLVEKVRINPGNYVDKKKFQQLEYTQSEYQTELERIRERFIPLIKVCKEYGTAMRIGTNHGSLSDRIMSYYGDTPRGMVESAMEFIRICADENYHELVISMKASNPKVMIEAYRLLVNAMMKENMNYPLHLGVTEAGDGEDGRIKSAAGIGALLEDGLGDTIRVSLTEAPEEEIPVAKALVNRYSQREKNPENLDYSISTYSHYLVSPFEYTRRVSLELGTLGGHQVPRVVCDISQLNLRDPQSLKSIGYTYNPVSDKYSISDTAADMVFLGDTLPSFEPPGNLDMILNYSTWKNHPENYRFHPFILFGDYAQYLVDQPENRNKKHFIQAGPEEIDEVFLDHLKGSPGAVFVLVAGTESVMTPFRQIYFSLLEKGVKCPVILKKIYTHLDSESILLYASTDFGGLFVDGFGDGIWIDNLSLAFGILQACRTRTSRTEYISCPSCGRTLFDLMEVTQMIRSQTGHLKGVKIGIMGCIVNGPGEMADADYGYVGSGPGKITLYRGKEVVKKNVDSDKAVAELIQIIEEDGNWVELKQS